LYSYAGPLQNDIALEQKLDIANFVLDGIYLMKRRKLGQTHKHNSCNAVSYKQLSSGLAKSVGLVELQVCNMQLDNTDPHTNYDILISTLPNSK
jgi:hypothetical protein